MTTSKYFAIRSSQAVLALLVLIHLILPFTPVNTHGETQILIGSLVLGFSFLSLGFMSFSKPHPFLSYGLILLLTVYVVSAFTGASPIGEGIYVKIVFALLLARGAFVAYRSKHLYHA